MRITTTALALLLTATIAVSQNDVRLYPVTDNAKFGFANASGHLVIPPRFDWAGGFHDGLAMIEVDGKKGFMDASGKIIVDPKYDEAGDFSEGLAVVSSNYRWGYIDTSGKEGIPLQFIEAYSFSDGLAAVYVQSDDPKKDSQWGYVDKKGNIAIPPKFFKALDFHDGVAKVIVGKFGEDNKQGFIDKSGKFIVRPLFELAGEHSEGLIPVEVGGRSEKFGERLYRHISGKWGYVNAEGSLIIPAKFDHADEFSEGMANVMIGKKYGYADKTGKVVIDPQFDYSSGSYRCAKFVEGRACFERDGKIGFIDTQGKVVIEPQFESVTTFLNGIAQVDFGVYPGDEKERFPISDNYGLINRNGNVVYKPRNKRAIAASIPVDPKEYIGWQKIDEKTFSFYAPATVKGGLQRGIDTAVYRYEGLDLQISFDIGFMANPRPKRPADSLISIDGQNAGVWYSKDRAHLHVALGANYTKTQFNMYIFSNDSRLREIAEKMFSSLRFKE